MDAEHIIRFHMWTENFCSFFAPKVAFSNLSGIVWTSLNVAKTELMIIRSRQRLHAQCDEIDISIDDKMVKRVDHTKSLGLTIDA